MSTEPALPSIIVDAAAWDAYCDRGRRPDHGADIPEHIYALAHAACAARPDADPYDTAYAAVEAVTPDLLDDIDDGEAVG